VLFLTLWTGGWNAQDAHACKQAFAEIRATDDRHARAAHLLDYSFVQRWSSAYREAHQNTVESLAILVAGDTAPPISTPPILSANAWSPGMGSSGETSL